MTRLRLPAALLLLLALVGVPAAADEAPSTRCTFAGTAPGFRAMLVELTAPSDVLILQLHGQRRSRPLNDESGWHLAEGIAVIHADSRDLVAHQLRYSGTIAPSVVAEAGGHRVSQGIVAPEGPWTHSSRDIPPRLAAGRYWVVAFGTGGPSTGALAQQWSASISLRGVHACHAHAAGETFDFDHRHFTGGTQVYAAGVGAAESSTLGFSTERPLVFGLMSARAQGSSVSTAELAFSLPAGTDGRVQGSLVPFVSTAGEHTFTTAYRGLHPIVAVTGAALELPAR
jgi:hypothetical protein